MLFHLHLRKRFSKLEPYPSKNFRKRWLDRIIYAIGILGPITAIPQIVLIYGEHTAAGISPTSWIVWTLLDLPWIFYGLVHKEPPIVITYSLWFVCNLLVFIGAIMY